jgi:hypothetical protein
LSSAAGEVANVEQRLEVANVERRVHIAMARCRGTGLQTATPGGTQLSFETRFFERVL